MQITVTVMPGAGRKTLNLTGIYTVERFIQECGTVVEIRDLLGDFDPESRAWSLNGEALSRTEWAGRTLRNGDALTAALKTKGNS